MLLSTLVSTSAQVAGQSGRIAKVALLAEWLTSVPASEIEIAVGFMTGQIRQGRIGLGWATLQGAMPGEVPEMPTLHLLEIDGLFEQLARVKGKGSAGERVRLVHSLLSRATEPERHFLTGLISGEIRQGAQEGVVTEAVAQAASVSVDLLRRALMTAGELPSVARAALTGGATALATYTIQLFRPVLPMLAGSAANSDDALAQLGEAALEWKLDGARVQVHKCGDEVRAFSRGLLDVTEAVPELVSLVQALPAREIILDGETIALRDDGRPHPFQVTMRRYGRRLDVARLRAELPLSSFFFDILWLDGLPLIDEPQSRRLDAMRGVIPSDSLVPGIVTGSKQEASDFLASAIRHGHEGIMAKALDSAYEAGRRGGRWLKVKPAHTLDLVVLAAEWGHGRRQGWLSNLHLGARDPVGGGFVMLGKTFKGMTDAMLEWQTERFLALEIGRDGHTVYLRPEVVVEVAFDGVQASSTYPGQVALRFARVKRYRTDKSAMEADTIEAVRNLA